MNSPSSITMSPAVAAAVAGRQPVVALESTVYSTLGLPAPHNKQVLEASQQAITDGGATPALTAVINGRPMVGLDDPTPVLTATAKVAARDLAVAMAKRWSVGVTTVGASLTLAHHVGVNVFATGGIGGVHRGDDGDFSADLTALGRFPVAVVCAGAKAVLDLPRTLEALETLEVRETGVRELFAR